MINFSMQWPGDRFRVWMTSQITIATSKEWNVTPKGRCFFSTIIEP